ncbi:MAG: creatininase family protein, partial [Atribacterota bacterium]
MAKKVYHSEMTFSDFKEGHFNKAIFGVGSAENHGFHLPFGNDTLVSHALSLEVAQRVEGMLVLPPVNVGVSTHYDDFLFTLTL